MAGRQSPGLPSAAHYVRQSRARTSIFVALTVAVTSLAGDGLCGGVTIAFSKQVRGEVTPSLDIAASQPQATEDGIRVGAQAARIEVGDAHFDDGSLAWYRLAYINGGNRLQVFEDYRRERRHRNRDRTREEQALRLANEGTGSTGAQNSPELPDRAESGPATTPGPRPA